MTSTFLPPALATVVKKTNNWQFYSSNNLHFFKGCHKIYNFVLIYRQILEASKRRKRKEKQFQLQIFGLWCWLVGWRKNAFCQYWVVTGCLNILNIGFGHENSVQIWILSIFLCTSSSFELGWCRDKFLSWPLVHIPPTLMQTGPSNAKFSVFDYRRHRQWMSIKLLWRPFEIQAQSANMADSEI